jgi:hypothetical protein
MTRTQPLSGREGVSATQAVMCSNGASPKTLSEQQLYDYGYYNLGQRLAPIHGVTFPTPAGGTPSPGMARTFARNAQLLDLARLIPVERRLSAGERWIRTFGSAQSRAMVEAANA